MSLTPSLYKRTRFLWLFSRGRFASCHLDPSAWLSPLQVRGAGGLLAVGADASVYGMLAFERPGARISIGGDTHVGGNTLIASATSVEVGANVLIAWNVTIVDHDSHSPDPTVRAKDNADWRRGVKDWTGVATAPVVLKDRSWVGFGASILKGVTIHEGGIVAAMSVVTKDVPAGCTVAGNPARIIREPGAND